MSDLLLAPVRATSDERRADEWALVLASAGIPHRLDRWSGGFELLVSMADLFAARSALDAADVESVARGDDDPAAVAPYPTSYAGVWLGAALAVFFLVTGARRATGPWFQHGEASAEWIVAGHWWRAVTALTLHADAAHVAGNAASAAVFVTFVCRWLGPGWGGALVLASGALGNLATAWAYQANHYSVGASTAIFGAVGILGVLEFQRRRQATSRRRPAWLALAASLGLLAMLGTGEHSDVMAHFAGFTSGAALAGAAMIFRVPVPRAGMQWLLGLLAATAIAVSWLIAWR